MPNNSNKSLSSKNGTIFIIFLLCATLFVVAYFTYTDKNTIADDADNINADHTDVNTNIADDADINADNTNTETTEFYTDADLPFIIKGYTSAEKTVTGDITGYVFSDQNSINVMPVDYEGMVKNSIGNVSEEIVTIDSVEGLKVIGSSPKDGSPTLMYLIKQAGVLYVFKGNPAWLNSLTAVISFKNNK